MVYLSLDTVISLAEMGISVDFRVFVANGYSATTAAVFVLSYNNAKHEGGFHIKQYGMCGFSGYQFSA